MTFNMLLWRWSEDYDSPTKRKKKGLKFSDITSRFAETTDHPAIGQTDVAAFRLAVDAEFGKDEDNRPFVFEDYGKCAVVNYPNEVRFELVPRIAAIARRFGLNTCEF